MNPERSRKFLAALGASVPVAQSRKGYLVSSCPLAPWRHEGGVDNNPSFAAELATGDALTHCFSCGWHGPASRLAMEVSHLNKVTPRESPPAIAKANEILLEAEQQEPLEIDFGERSYEERILAGGEEMMEFPEWWLDTFPTVAAVGGAYRDYLLERGVPEALWWEYDLRADTTLQRIGVPVRDFDGVLRGFHGRAIQPGAKLRYKAYKFADVYNQLVWFGENKVDTTRPVVFVEGPFDLFAVRRVYANVVSPLFATPSYEKLRRMSDALEVLTFFDRGAGGDAGRKRVDHAFDQGQYVVHLQPPTGRKDPGVCTDDELRELLAPHVQLIA